MHVITGINHITLSVSNLEQSFSFYTEVLGLKPIAKWMHGAYLLAGTDWVCLSLDSETRKEPQPEYTHVAFSVGVDAFSTCAAAIHAHGVSIWQDNKSEGDSLYFLDPDGHKLEIHVGDLESRLMSLQSNPYEGLQLFV